MENEKNVNVMYSFTGKYFEGTLQANSQIIHENENRLLRQLQALQTQIKSD